MRVGVVVAGELAVGLLDLALRRVLGHAKDLVKVFGRPVCATHSRHLLFFMTLLFAEIFAVSACLLVALGPVVNWPVVNWPVVTWPGVHRAGLHPDVDSQAPIN